MSDLADGKLRVGKILSVFVRTHLSAKNKTFIQRISEDIPNQGIFKKLVVDKGSISESKTITKTIYSVFITGSGPVFSRQLQKRPAQFEKSHFNISRYTTVKDVAIDCNETVHYFQKIVDVSITTDCIAPCRISKVKHIDEIIVVWRPLAETPPPKPARGLLRKCSNFEITLPPEISEVKNLSTPLMWDELKSHSGNNPCYDLNTSSLELDNVSRSLQEEPTTSIIRILTDLDVQTASQLTKQLNESFDSMKKNSSAKIIRSKISTTTTKFEKSSLKKLKRTVSSPSSLLKSSLAVQARSALQKETADLNHSPQAPPRWRQRFSLKSTGIQSRPSLKIPIKPNDNGPKNKITVASGDEQAVLPELDVVYNFSERLNKNVQFSPCRDYDCETSFVELSCLPGKNSLAFTRDDSRFLDPALQDELKDLELFHDFVDNFAEEERSSSPGRESSLKSIQSVSYNTGDKGSISSQPEFCLEAEKFPELDIIYDKTKDAVEVCSDMNCVTEYITLSHKEDESINGGPPCPVKTYNEDKSNQPKNKTVPLISAHRRKSLSFSISREKSKGSIKIPILAKVRPQQKKQHKSERKSAQRKIAHETDAETPLLDLAAKDDDNTMVAASESNATVERNLNSYISEDENSTKSHISICELQTSSLRLASTCSSESTSTETRLKQIAFEIENIYHTKTMPADLDPIKISKDQYLSEKNKSGGSSSEEISVLKISSQKKVIENDDLKGTGFSDQNKIDTSKTLIVETSKCNAVIMGNGSESDSKLKVLHNRLTVSEDLSGTSDDNTSIKSFSCSSVSIRPPALEPQVITSTVSSSTTESKSESKKIAKKDCEQHVKKMPYAEEAAQQKSGCKLEEVPRVKSRTCTVTSGTCSIDSDSSSPQESRHSFARQQNFTSDNNGNLQSDITHLNEHVENEMWQSSEDESKKEPSPNKKKTRKKKKKKTKRVRRVTIFRYLDEYGNCISTETQHNTTQGVSSVKSGNIIPSLAPSNPTTKKKRVRRITRYVNEQGEELNRKFVHQNVGFQNTPSEGTRKVPEELNTKLGLPVSRKFSTRKRVASGEGSSKCESSDAEAFIDWKNSLKKPKLLNFQNSRELGTPTDIRILLQLLIGNPLAAPTINPLAAPNLNPIAAPNLNPLAAPTLNPLAAPTLNPVATPTLNPLAAPTLNPLAAPTINPLAAPTLNPLANPTLNPLAYSTLNPLTAPTFNPLAAPTLNPLAAPTINPLAAPTFNPLAAPTINPVAAPTLNPLAAPTLNPVATPTINHLASPTINPLSAPTLNPLSAPTINPLPAPTLNPLAT
ncbi:hypothetical protein ACHWQZ_G000759 [Mnemiopsis leidyi]